MLSKVTLFIMVFLIPGLVLACACGIQHKKAHKVHKVKHYKHQPVYYSCPGLGAGTTLKYGPMRNPQWQVFFQGGGESITFNHYQQCNLVDLNPGAYSFQCYFTYFDNVDGYYEANGLSGTVERKLQIGRSCRCVSNTTIRCD